MEVVTIKGDEVVIVYHPQDEPAEVGAQFKILQLPEKKHGLIVQVISNDSLEYIGLQQEIIQKVLEEKMTMVARPLDRESGMGQMKSLKLAIAKIRKTITDNNWLNWDGWIPTRNVVVTPLEANELILNIIPPTNFPIAFSLLDNLPIKLDGEKLNMVNVITGVKGSGKSHTAKHLVLQLARHNVPVVVFDVNGEYTSLPNAQVFKWGQDFRPSLWDFGYGILQQVMQAVYPLPDNSEAVFSTRLPQIWGLRREYLKKNPKTPGELDIPFLLQQKWGGGDFVVDAINRRLEMIDGMNLFSRNAANNQSTNFRTIYDFAAGDENNEGKPIIFDMRELSAQLQQALVRAISDFLKDICKEETNGRVNAQGELEAPPLHRYPFVFYEEAHFYIKEEVIVDIITRGRHIGMGAFFVTNTPQELPRTVFRQLDNLFLLSLTHNDDIRNVSQSSFTDEDTIRSFATRMPQYHSLIIGNVTSRYPLVVKVAELPDNVPASGRTRSTWDRFK